MLPINSEAILVPFDLGGMSDSVMKNLQVLIIISVDWYRGGEDLSGKGDRKFHSTLYSENRKSTSLSKASY